MTDTTETIEIDEDVPAGPESDGEKEPYRSLLELWRAVLSPAVDGEMVNDPISPQWATKMVTTYPQITFKDTAHIHVGVFEKAAELAKILDDEIATDDECLNVMSAEEDREHNSQHYLNLLAGWQIYLLEEELGWNPEDDDAAVQLAILSEVHQMFLTQTGFIGHLDEIGFQFTEGDQSELQRKLFDAKQHWLGKEGDGE
jgi:hypothetical protein